MWDWTIFEGAGKGGGWGLAQGEQGIDRSGGGTFS